MRIIRNPKRGKRGFTLPEKKMDKPIRRRGRWIASYSRGAPGTRKVRGVVAHKTRKWAFKISSP